MAQKVSLKKVPEVQQYTGITLIDFQECILIFVIIAQACFNAKHSGVKLTVMSIYQFKTDLSIQKVNFRIVPVWHQRCNRHGIQK